MFEMIVSKEKMMFSEALVIMLLGGKCRRAIWPAGQYLTVNSRSITCHYLEYGKKDTWGYVITSDILAHDWEVITVRELDGRNMAETA